MAYHCITKPHNEDEVTKKLKEIGFNKVQAGEWNGYMTPDNELLVRPNHNFSRFQVQIKEVEDATNPGSKYNSLIRRLADTLGALSIENDFKEDCSKKFIKKQ